MAERSPSAQRYRDVFERIKMNVLDGTERVNHHEKHRTGILDAEMTQRCQSLDRSMLDTVKTDYDQIIADLAKDTAKVDLKDAVELSTQFHDLPRDLHARPAEIATQMWNENMPAMPDYGVAHSFGTFVESAFMFNLDDLHHFDMEMQFLDDSETAGFT